MTAVSCDTDVRRPFGDVARRYVAGLPPSVSVIAADLENAALALAAAADLRRRGVVFYSAPLLEDGRASAAQAISGKLLDNNASVDERRAVFDALANEHDRASGFESMAAPGVRSPHMKALRDLVIMSDAVLVRSSIAGVIVARELGYRRRFNAVAAGVDEDVPRVVASPKGSVVVWAPRLDADKLGVIAMALEMFRCDIVFVCASGSLPNVRGSFVRAADAAEALSAASCIIDASIADPAPAISLLTLSVPIVIASTTGASDFIHGAFEYDPWNFRSIHAAISRARGATPPLVRGLAIPVEDLRATLCAAAPPAVSSGPLVSIVLPTYNRPVSLAKSLDYIVAQTYKSLDVIVVNDGGCDIRDVCARYPFVRLINLEINVGNPHATRAGMTHVKGKYFGFWGDDDWYFPDHFARIVSALENSGGYVGHTQTLTRYYTDRPDGGQQTRAYKILHERPNDPIEMMTGPTMTFGLMLFRRELVDEIGYVDPDTSLMDTEYQSRASHQYDFIAIDAVTGQWNYDIDLKSYQHQIGETRYVADQKSIYAKYPSELSCVNVRRERWLRKLTERYNSVLWPPDLYLPDDFCD